MSIIKALNWRYAAKRMNGVDIPKSKLDIILQAISLAPTSFGLQPFSILVIEDKAMLAKIKPIAMMQPQITEASALIVFAVWEKLTQEKIDAYIQNIATERHLSIESLDDFSGYIEGQLKKTDEEILVWSSKQAYIALGFGLVCAAVEEIDSTPMEGFDKDLLDDVLGLKEKGLRSVVMLALGYRDIKNDYLVNLKKVRREQSELIIKIN